MNSPKIQIVGIISHISGIENVSENFTKCTLLLSVEKPGFTPEVYPFQFTQIRAAFPSQFGVGEKVEVTGYLQGVGFQKEGLEPTAFLNINGTNIKRVG